jgi:gliding motility-associated-like protein
MDKTFLKSICRYAAVGILSIWAGKCFAQETSVFEWAKRIGGSASDRGEAITIDGSGNTYVTGYFNGTMDFDPGIATVNLTSRSGGEAFICKFDLNGNFIWARSITGTSGSATSAAIATDAVGNVFITGRFTGTSDFNTNAGILNITSAGIDDMFILKLDTNGDFIWAKTIGGAGSEISYSIAIDNLGNVYTTGTCTGPADFDPGPGVFNISPNSGYSTFFLKLDSNGDFVWAKITGAGTSNIDGGRSIALDASSNVYVTGQFTGTVDFNPGAGVSNLTSNTPGFSDIYICKLDSDGNYVWAKSIGGTTWDYGNAITIDASGNVNAAGRFFGPADFDPGPGVNLLGSGLSGIYILKLDGDGNFIWAKAVEGTLIYRSGLALDGFGNIHITGSFSGTIDFDPGLGVFNLTSTIWDAFVLKLDIVGNFVWASTTIVGNTDFDEPYSMAANSSGDMYLTGYFSATSDFDPSSCTFNMISAGLSDIFIQKLSSGTAGLLPTITSFSPTAGSIGTTVTITGNNFSATPANNIVTFFNNKTAIVTASTATSLTTTVPTGTTTGKISVTVNCVTVQSTSDFIVGTASLPTITSFTPPSGGISTTVSITGTNFSTTPANNTVKFNGTTAVVTASTATSIICTVPSGATTGKITVTVSGNTATSASDFTVTTSSQNWLRHISASGSQIGEAIAIDGSGNSYTCGYFSNTVDFNPGAGVFNLTAQSGDVFLVKLDAIGEFVWAKKMGGAGIDQGLAIQIDSNGNLYLAGTFGGTADFDPGAGIFNLTSVGSRDIFIAKLDNDGNFVWAKSISGSNSKDLTGIALDATGNIYATGYFNATADFDPGASIANLTSAGSGDIFLLKLDNDGNFVWAKQIGSTGLDVSEGVIVSASGYPHLTGYFEGTVDFDSGPGTAILTSQGDIDIFITKFDDAGNLLWAESIGSASQEYGFALTTDADESIYITGSFSSETDFDPGAGVYNLALGSQDENAFILKLLSDGSFSWATKFGGSYGSSSPFSIGLDGSENAYVIGDSFDGSDANEIIMAGFNTNGNTLFVDIAYGLGTGKSIAVSPTGDIYATGDFTGAVSFNLGDCLGSLIGVSDDAFILKTRANSFSTPTIASFSPMSGVEGTTVIITGTNFSTIPDNNNVDFDGVQAIVIASTATTITTSVPVGSITGKISVSTGCGTAATSASDFTVETVANEPPIIQPTTTAVPIDGIITIDLLPLISDPDDNLDLSTLSLVSSISDEGASAMLVGATQLELNYGNVAFAGTDRISISVCDLLSACTVQELSIEISGEIEIFNAVSPNNDNKNEIFRIANIDLLQPDNKVTIYNRWGSKVFEVDNYNNADRVFKGLNDNGGELPSGTYFYKIVFTDGESKSGYLTLKR